MCLVFWGRRRIRFYHQVSKLMPTNVKFYIQRLYPSTHHFTILLNHEQFIFLMSCKDRQILTCLGKFLHKSFDIRSNVSRVFRRNNIISSMLAIVFNCILLVPISQAILNSHVVKKMRDFLLPIYIYIYIYRTATQLQISGNLYQRF